MANRTDVLVDLHDPLIVKVLWASMCAMVKDVHSPQDNLSEDEWEMAEHLFIQLDALVNESAP
jgi:hypothetical protein